MGLTDSAKAGLTIVLEVQLCWRLEPSQTFPNLSRASSHAYGEVALKSEIGP